MAKQSKAATLPTASTSADNAEAPPVPVVRELTLRRRRTSVPWIYSLYHAEPRRPSAKPKRETGQPSCRRRKAGTSSGEGGSSAPPPAAAAIGGLVGNSSTGRREMAMRPPPPPAAARSMPASCRQAE
jgi:hypothetical protein